MNTDSQTKLIINERISLGGNGEVFSAFLVGENGYRKKVAAKKISSSVSNEKIIEEAKVQAILNHPSICSVIDIRTSSGITYLILEYIEGVTLKSLIDEKVLTESNFTHQFIKKFLLDMGNALNYAHSKDVVHRDLSPSNIIVTNQETFKIIDFGLAAEIDEEQNNKTKTLSGTFEYLSPERINGVKLNKESDFFALGIIAYELLTLKKPFSGGNDFELLSNIKEKEIKRPNNANDSNSKIFDVVLGLLDKSKTNRYTNTEIVQILKLNTNFRKRKFFLFTSMLIISAAILTYFFVNMYFEKKRILIYEKKENETFLLKPIEKDYNKNFNKMQCALIYNRATGFFDVLFSEQGRAEFFVNKYKDNLKKGLTDILIYMGKGRENQDKLLKNCADSDENYNSKFNTKNLTDVLLSHLIYVNDNGKNISDLNSEGFSDKGVQSSMNKVIPEPFPGQVEKTLLNTKLSNELKLLNLNFSTKQFVKIGLVNMPSIMTFSDCRYIATYFWLNEYASGQYPDLKLDTKARFLLYNSDDINIKKISDKEVYISRNKESNLCVFEKNDINSDTVEIY